ncbi:olfactory receptor 52P1-like [Emydura macquarii macquarii]|uniref:olfactory receptor 52P1-like n=1 Tax=Emydura macquarii macquarii TaxID=1129001 RepID=UPI00352B3C85
MVLFVVSKEQTLHKPMYLLLCMLAVTEIGTSTCVVPNALCIFWFGFKAITVDVCVTQIFFLYMLAAMHSAVLMIMAFDRYVAICDPLRYATILTNALITKLGLLGLIRAVLLILPVPLLLRRLPFGAYRVIPHTYCDDMAVVKVSCGDTRVNQTYTLVITLVIIGIDLTLIGLSYGLIIRAVLRISSKKSHQESPQHLHSPHLFNEGISAHVHILSANLYLLLPPMLNPIIYGVKTKELRNQVGKYTCRM